jgi:hypothetical protein
MTRALSALLHGDVATALAFHRLIILVTILLISESAFRAVSLVMSYKDRIQPTWISVDIWIHAALAVLVPLMFVI